MLPYAVNRLTNHAPARALQSVVITGASSGIGAALAKQYAASGTTLGLIGRNLARLQAVAEDCRAKGAQVEIGHIDVCEREILEQWLQDFYAKYSVDLLVANAGIAIGLNNGIETPKNTQEIFDTNLQGVLNTVLPLWDAMISRKNGQIALVSSVAGFRGLPNAPAYSASKVAVRALGEAWRAHLSPQGIRINVICPGFVHSGITAKNRFPMPGIITAEKAAIIIQEKLARNQAIITFPWWMAYPAWLMACLPVDWVDALLSRMPKK